ncbi:MULTISPECIES: hypothetical protein [Actinomycetaceae]|uniref:hypothetical protein n=1 Tax=Actinomycetaceae TaxID=2049 RepID=UPI0008A15417|nr:MULTISPECIES: hypothetical protein [Actinomycetaceae]MBS5826986.1 hypothetical protein [Actinomyces sp.]MDP9834199.1 hypothetical protein [Gleimia europaea]OFJ62036.1 hypothetical protein HMPREF2854_06270 [Actinomyces sp. HMSC075B09]
MLQPAFFIFVTLTVILALAVGVLVVLLVTRRSVSDWQVHLEKTTSEWKQADNEGQKPDPVTPRKSSLEAVIKKEGREGSAYLRAEELPSLEQRPTLSDD